MRKAYERQTKEPCQDAIISEIKRVVSSVTGFPWARIKCENRNKHLVVARFLFCYVVKTRFPKLPLSKIGEMLNGRDHSTALHAIQTVKEMIESEDPQYTNWLKKIIACMPDDSQIPKIPVIDVKRFRKFTTIKQPEPPQFVRPPAVYSNRNFWEDN